MSIRILDVEARLITQRYNPVVLYTELDLCYYISPLAADWFVFAGDDTEITKLERIIVV